MPSYKYTAGGAVRWRCAFYYRDYTGRNVKKKKSGFLTKREADAWEKSFLLKRSGGTSMTFAQLLEVYLEDARHRLKPSTVYTTGNLLRSSVLPTFGAVPVGDITPAAVRAWENNLLAGGRFARSTLAEMRAAFSKVLNFAVRLYGLNQNPVKAAGPFVEQGGRRQEDSLHVWTREQFDAFITSGLAPEYITLFSVLFWTGCRIGEALALTVADIDFDTSTMAITKDCINVYPGGVRAQKPKTAASVRRVTMPAQLVEVLKDWIRETDATRPADMLFRLRIHNTAGTILHSGAARAGLPPIRVHDLRHSHASMLINMGFPPIVIRDRLGHKNIQTTLNIYAHLYPRAMDSVAARLSAV